MNIRSRKRHIDPGYDVPYTLLMDTGFCRLVGVLYRWTIRLPLSAVSLAWCSLLVALLPAAAAGQAELVVYEHRVVVATTSLDRELDVEESLLRNVNRLAAIGFEVGAILGGDGAIIDRMLFRDPNHSAQVDHAGHVFVIMHRPYLRPSPVREYRFLHARHELGVEKIVAGYGREGFRLTATAWEGETFHAAFERQAGAEPVDYRVFRTERRRGWDRHMMGDPDVPRRLRRVIPMFPQAAIAELGEPADPPAEFVWLDAPAHSHFRLRDPLSERAAAGFRTQVLRLYRNEVLIAMLKPAGATGPAPELKLDEGPWGGPCSNGFIAGADVHVEGTVFCVAEDPKGPIRNRGFDVALRPQQEDSDGDLFRGAAPCEVRAQLGSNRPAARRVARALQLEEELNGARDLPGFRITRAFANPREDRDDLLIFMGTRTPIPTFSGPAAPSAAAPRLVPEVDGLLQGYLAQHEESINERLQAEMGPLDVIAWVEINDQRANNYVRLAGCSRTRFHRDHAESVLRGILVRTAYSRYRIRNEIIVEPGR